MIYFKKFTDHFEVNFTGLFEVKSTHRVYRSYFQFQLLQKVRILILQDASFFTSKEYFTHNNITQKYKKWQNDNDKMIYINFILQDCGGAKIAMRSCICK